MSLCFGIWKPLVYPTMTALQQVGSDEIEYCTRIELSKMGSSRSQVSVSLPTDHQHHCDCEDHDELQCQCQWAAVQRLPSFERISTALFDDNTNTNTNRKQVINVTKLGADDRHLFIQKLIKHIENDNLRLLQQLRRRIDRYVIFPAPPLVYHVLCLEPSPYLFPIVILQGWSRIA